jgi:hypothetical protein
MKIEVLLALEKRVIAREFRDRVCAVNSNGDEIAPRPGMWFVEVESRDDPFEGHVYLDAGRFFEYVAGDDRAPAGFYEEDSGEPARNGSILLLQGEAS